MNSFGTLLRAQIFGESHGPLIGVLLDGVPAGLPLKAGDFERDLDRRRSGRPGTTPRLEKDEPQLLSGVHQGHCTGSPLLLACPNTSTRSEEYEALRRYPRPGHADWTASLKYGGWNDPRGGGHFSGRLTWGLVCAGVVAKALLGPVRFHSLLTDLQGHPLDEQILRQAGEEHDSLGGLITTTVEGVPPGLGEPFFHSVESLLAQGLFSIPGVRGVEFGTGFAAAGMRGSHHNDPFLNAAGHTRTNHAGGISGGISNTNPLHLRVAVKPTASIDQPQETVDLATGEGVSRTCGGRHDRCFALRVPVVVEAVCALVLADLLLQQRSRRIFPHTPDLPLAFRDFIEQGGSPAGSGTRPPTNKESS